MRKKFESLIDEETALLDSAKELTIDYCKISKTFRSNKKWTPFAEESLIKLIKNHLVFTKFSHITNIEVELSESPLEETHALVFVQGELNGKTYNQEYDFQYNVRYLESPIVSKEKSGNYFQGVLQIRNPTSEVKKYLQKRLAQSRGVFASRLVEKDNILDAHISDNRFIRKVALEIEANFEANIQFASQLHTFDHLTSKDMHRLTALVVCYPFTKNDAIEYDGQYYVVRQVQKYAQLENIKTGELRKVSAFDVKDIKKLKPVRAKIIAIKPELTILHPTAFQPTVPIKISQKKHTFEVEDTIDVYCIDNGVYII
jgi:NMD protein affecting ribosome stability and mRNA decay